MSDILTKIIDQIKSDEAETFRTFKPYNLAKRQASALESIISDPDGFLVISECKKASPSKGVIVEDYQPAKIAMQYKEGGAKAISVLTEKNYFLGAKQDLTDVKTATGLPVLRKDFIFHPAQVYQARELGADLVLLIIAALDEKVYLELHSLILELGMVPLVEIHNEEELHIAAKAPLVLLGINNRNLKTFEIDLNNCLRLKKLIDPRISVIAESGISNHHEVALLRSNGFKGILVGESLLRQSDRTSALKELLNGKQPS